MLADTGAVNGVPEAKTNVAPMVRCFPVDHVITAFSSCGRSWFAGYVWLCPSSLRCVLLS